MHATERASRMAVVRAELMGMSIQGENEPSNALINKYCAMVDEGAIRALKWSDLGRKDLEIKGEKQEHFVHIDANGSIVQKSRYAEQEADVGTDLKLRAAFTRRGVALQVARIMKYQVREQWVKKLFAEYTREAYHGYASVSLEQMQRADDEFWAEMATLTPEGLKSPLGNKYPLDDFALQAIKDGTRVSSLLCQLPALTGRRENHTSVKRDAAFDHLKEENKRLKSRLDGGGQSRGSSSSGPTKPRKKGEGKGKGEGVLPMALKGMDSTYKGKRICFGYNLGTCTGKLDADGACSKGLHVCMQRGCGWAHPQSACQRK